MVIVIASPMAPRYASLERRRRKLPLARQGAVGHVNGTSLSPELALSDALDRTRVTAQATQAFSLLVN